MNHKHNDDFGLKEIIYWNANSIGGGNWRRQSTPLVANNIFSH